MSNQNSFFSPPQKEDFFPNNLIVFIFQFVWMQFGATGSFFALVLTLHLKLNWGHWLRGYFRSCSNNITLLQGFFNPIYIQAVCGAEGGEYYYIKASLKINQGGVTKIALATSDKGLQRDSPKSDARLIEFRCKCNGIYLSAAGGVAWLLAPPKGGVSTTLDIENAQSSQSPLNNFINSRAIKKSPNRCTHYKVI